MCPDSHDATADAPERPRVFVSAKSSDYEHAARVYEFLTASGVSTFFSQESLPQLGVSDYRREIDRALDEAEHMVVVTSSAEHAQSPWVEAEWGFFINEKRSGRKRGNLVTVVTGALRPGDLPPSLRYYEVIRLEDGLDTLVRYLKDVGAERPLLDGAPRGPDHGPAVLGRRPADRVGTSRWQRPRLRREG